MSKKAMKRILSSKLLLFSIALMAIAAIAVTLIYPRGGPLPDLNVAIEAGRNAVDRSVYSKCGRSFKIKYKSHRSFDSRKNISGYTIVYDIDFEDEGIAGANAMVWGRTNLFRKIFSRGHSIPIVDVIGLDTWC